MTTSGESGPGDRLTEATLSGVRWISLARIAGEVIAFATMVALARLIGPSEFGKFAIAVVVHEIALTITGEGIGTALVQRRSIKRAHLQAGMFMSVALGLVLGAIAFAVAPLIFTPLFGEGTTDLVLLSTPLFVIAGVTAVPLAVVQRRLDFRLISLVQMFSLVVRAGVALALALAGLEAAALVLGVLAGSAAMMTLLLVVARVPWPRPRLAAMRDIWGFGVPAALSGLSWTGFRNADFAIVGARLGAAELGLYWRAYQLAIEYQRKIGSAVHQVMFPVYSRTDDLESMFAMRRRVVRVVSAVLIPGLATLALLAPLLVPWLFGPAWEGAVVPTQILAIAGMFTVLSDTMGAVVLAAGRARGWFVYHLGCFAAYAGAVYVAAGLGLNAVCWAVVGVQGLGTLVAYRVLLHGLVERPLSHLWADVAPGGAGALGIVAAAAPVMWALSGVGSPVPLTLAGASAAGAIGCLIALRFASPATWRDLTRVIRRVTGRRATSSETASYSMAEAPSS